jgi:hypothetical protein
LGSKITFTQETWSKRLGDIQFDSDPTNTNWEDCYYVSFNDSGIVIFFGWVDTSIVDWRIRFMELSYSGNEVYTKDYGQNGQNWYAGFRDAGYKTETGNYLIPVTIEPNNGLDGTFPGIIKFNTIGDTLWMRSYYDASKFYSVEKVIQCSDGNIVLVGGTTPDSLEYNPQIFVMKVDEDGNEIWVHEYGQETNAGEYGLSIAETEEGGYIVGGYKLNTDISNPNHYLIAIDSVGSFLWDQVIGSSLFREYAMNINALSDGNFVCVSGKGVYLDEGDTYIQCHIRKINSDGDVIWENDIGNISELSYFLNSKEGPEGSIYALGMIQTTDPTNQINSEVGTIAKFSADGDSLWMREYSYVSEELEDTYILNSLRDFELLPNGSIVASGWILVVNNPDIEEDYPGQDLWVFKTDSMGCLVAGCDTVVGISEYTEYIEQSWFTYGPNPVRDQFYIYITEINQTIFQEIRFELRNLDGKLIKQFQGKQDGGISYIMDVNDTKSGMYLLTLYGNGKKLQSEKIIIQH